MIVLCSISNCAAHQEKSNKVGNREVHPTYSEAQGMVEVWKIVITFVSLPRVMPADDLSLVFSTGRYYSVVP